MDTHYTLTFGPRTETLDTLPQTTTAAGDAEGGSTPCAGSVTPLELEPSANEGEEGGGRLEVIRREAWRALIINRTVGEDIDKEHPTGWMPPAKREKIVAILQRILAAAGGREIRVATGRKSPNEKLTDKSQRGGASEAK